MLLQADKALLFLVKESPQDNGGAYKQANEYIPLISSQTAGTPGQLFTQGKPSEKYRAAKQV